MTYSINYVILLVLLENEKFPLNYVLLTKALIPGGNLRIAAIFFGSNHTINKGSSSKLEKGYIHKN